MRRNISYHDLCCPKGQVKMKLTILTSGYSLMGTYTFSERFIVAPHASGNTRGSDFFPLIWKRFPLTLPISEMRNKKFYECLYISNESLLQAKLVTVTIAYSDTFSDSQTIINRFQAIIVTNMWLQ